ncbi:MAG: thiamine pyrophosphate-dependent enzyme, partial [Bacteroidales bacterium]|nr:thiamine pyrophosphate-dependent enzyme [Bacteroidales bacterium]
GGRVIMTNGWSGMGFAIPAAIAAKLNNPQLNVIAVTGDGGFLMSAGEIATIRRLNLKIIIIVLCDRELNLIKLKQEKRELAPDRIDLYKGDLFEADKFLGVRVIEVESDESMNKAISSALLSDSASIINAKIDPEEYQKYVIV